jgi:hypothetical protein
LGKGEKALAKSRRSVRRGGDPDRAKDGNAIKSNLGGRELATILAALQHFLGTTDQEDLPESFCRADTYAHFFTEFTPLDDDEIIALGRLAHPRGTASRL